MDDMRLGMVESHFADIVWKNAPCSTKTLVALCADELEWKRTTTYTVLKKLCDRGIFALKDGTVSVLLSQKEYAAMQSEKFVCDTFSGSLPAFIAAFTSRKPLSQKEIDEIRAMIDAHSEG